MGWDVRRSERGASVLLFEVIRGERVISRAELLAALVGDPSLRAMLSEAIASAPFEALCWELPPLVGARPASFALVDSPALARTRADPSPFQAQFGSGDRAVAFWNLGRDALLVAPNPAFTSRAAHLAEFVRGNDAALVDAFWRRVGEAATERAREARPVWLSTAGLGVSWLHARLDDRPKYYRYRPFTQVDA